MAKDRMEPKSRQENERKTLAAMHLMEDQHMERGMSSESRRHTLETAHSVRGQLKRIHCSQRRIIIWLFVGVWLSALATLIRMISKGTHFWERLILLFPRREMS